MNQKLHKFSPLVLMLSIIGMTFTTPAQAQVKRQRVTATPQPAAIRINTDSMTISDGDSVIIKADSAIVASNMVQAIDSTKIRKRRDWNTWRPDPKRALWLALVVPGAGQIYNRKYWKLPIFYGGLVGCVYALQWNNQMYHDYAQAYMDLMDNNEATNSYNQFMHLGAEINDGNRERYQTLFKNRKDRYRRWRDLSFFAMVGIYALSVIDAYVDASLSEFDITPDLSLQVSPTIISNQAYLHSKKDAAVGLQCNITF